MMIQQLIEASRSGDTKQMLAIIQAHPEVLEQTAENGETPLIAAMYHGMREAVELLLDQGVHVNIFEAAAIGDEETVAFMLEHAPDLVNTYSYDGWSPLHLAAFFGAYEVAEVLIDKGADVNAFSRNAMVNMPIHVAAAGKRTVIVELLLQKGADPNVQQRGGWTPLHQAVEHFDKGMVQLLLDHGADPTIKQHQGKDAIMLAKEKQFDEIVELLGG